MSALDDSAAHGIISAKGFAQLAMVSREDDTRHLLAVSEGDVVHHEPAWRRGHVWITEVPRADEPGGTVLWAGRHAMPPADGPGAIDSFAGDGSPA